MPTHARSGNMVRWGIAAALGLGGRCALAVANGRPEEPVRWVLEDVKSVGGHTPTVLGAPKFDEKAPAMRFNGADDGLIVPVNPLSGCSEFTIEVLFQPDVSGPAEQRFLHFQEVDNHRGLLEIRLKETGQWSLDTFLCSGENQLTLLDRTKLHPAGKWTWVALVYDGRKMTSFVNGAKELEGEVTFAPMKTGQTSLGVRLNKVFWFKGAIREVRFHPRALEAAKLQRVK